MNSMQGNYIMIHLQNFIQSENMALQFVFGDKSRGKNKTKDEIDFGTAKNPVSSESAGSNDMKHYHEMK